MATETTKIVVETEVKGTAQVAQSLADLKKELKAAQSAALNGDGQAAKRVAELKDKLDDLKDATKTLQGSGVERADSSFRMLGEGLRNFDFEKIKIGFSGIGAALKAIPIFLIAEGVSYLVENWKELGEGTGIVAKAIQFLNGLMDEAKKGLDFLTDSLGLTNTALDKFGDSIKDNADKSKEALSGVTAEYDRQIRVAKANGKDTVELEKAKQQAIIDTNVQVAKQIEAFVRAGGVLDDEKRKLLTASLEAIKNAKVTEFEIETAHNQKVVADYKKTQDEKDKADQQRKENISKSLNDELNRRFQIAKEEREEREREQAKIDAEEAARAKLRDDLRKQEIDAEKAANAEKVASWQKAEADKQAAVNASFQHAQLVTQNLQAISDLTFALRSAKLKKGSAEEEALMRRQFEVNKGLQIAQTVISTITGAREAYKSLAGIPIVGVPLGIAAATAATVAGLAAIQKIRSTQFGSTSAPSTDTGGTGSISAGATSAPTTNTQAPTVQPFTRLNEDGTVVRNQPVVKAIVVESDITDSQNRVGRLKNQATFG